jgi:signal transduction histidine kinase
MTSKVQDQPDAWVKFDWLWIAAFYAGVLIPAGMVLFEDDPAVPVWAALLLTAVLLLWHWGGLRLAYRGGEYWYERAGIRLVILLGDIVLWFVLVNLSSAYYLVLFGLFPQIYRHLPIRYAVPASAFLTVTIIYLQLAGTEAGFSLANPAFWLFLLLGLLGIVLGIWVSSIIVQSSRRRELIEQLEAAQAELAAAERRAGVLEERQRLAREIHDTLAQGFTSIVMHLEAAEGALPDDLDTLQKHLDRARSTARTNLKQARRVVENLRPEVLEEFSLPDAIERTAARWREETGITLTTTITGTPIALHRDIEKTLLRAVQESLNNILRHAQASAVQLTLSYMEDVVMLDVQDNGAGFDEKGPAPTEGGYGLQAMRERAELCGGSVTVESDPGEGTTVVVSIPID